MANSTVDISEGSQELLRELADRTGQTISEVLDKALAAYRREVFFEKMNAGYAELRADAEDWSDHQAERKQWDAALLDGLDPDEHWTDDGTCRPLDP